MANKQLEQELERYASEQRGIILQRFFKTGKGEYGAGDVFLGLTMGEQRELAKKFQDLQMNELQELLNSKIHEKRMISLIILTRKFKKSDEEGKKQIFNFYIKNAKRINNWDLVDLSAPNIVGMFLMDKQRNILYKLASSENLWEKRISIISTFTFIRNGDFKDTLKISEKLLKERHDLIHKAVGWMLREVGKKNQEKLEEFLKKHYKQLPRTTLRYAIEKFEEGKRKRYLRGKI